MYFWFELFCLTLVLNNVVMDVSDFEFRNITLGHSGFLISWRKINAESLTHYFKFGYRIKDDQIYMNFSFSTFEDSYPPFGLPRYRIDSLKENTLYEVIIEAYSKDKELHGKSYSLYLKTHQRANTRPAKPDFVYTRYPSHPENSPEWLNYFDKFISWLPCGKEEDCQGKEAGTHFVIKARILDRRGEYKIEVYNDAREVRFLPGIYYEVSVISINNGFEMESDSQEIFKMPGCGPVTSVKIGPRNAHGSVKVSWKPPKYCDPSLNFKGYVFVRSIDVFSIIDTHNAYEFPYSFELSHNCCVQLLKPGDTYTFSIIPVGHNNTGFPYDGKFIVPAENNN